MHDQEKHTDVHLHFPSIAFLWLMAETSLFEQYNQAQCKDRLGHFFEAWCAYWHERGLRGSRAVRADLESILVLMQEDKSEIEAIYASIRRELFILSTQTHSVDFLELSDRHALRCMRRHPVSYGVSKHNDVVIDRALTSTECSDEPP